MKELYQIPTLVKVDSILKLLTSESRGIKQIDITKKLNSSKSSTHNIIKTLESLGWIMKESDDSYRLGPQIGVFGGAYFNQASLLHQFNFIGQKYLNIIDEHIQIGKLDDQNVIYLGKLMGRSPIDLVTYPGSVFPAHSTSVGKIQLINKNLEELETIFKDGLKEVTSNTITSLEKLNAQLQEAKKFGFIEEHGESAIGFHCVSAPIYDFNGKIIAGVSTAMTSDKWAIKSEVARKSIVEFAKEMSHLNGYKVKE